VGRTIELLIPPRNDHLALVRRVVAAAAATDEALSARRIDDLSLAVSEACANAIDAQRAIEAAAPVAIRIELDERVVAVTVTDHAGGFSPDDVDPLPAVDDPGRLRHEHGLGLPLIRSLSESVTFRSTDDGTEVRMVVGANPADRAAPEGVRDEAAG
jgi:anti-sigma regulatory factor (Ser/Thr protein kinase)